MNYWLCQQPDASQVYSNILYQFGRGMALAQQGKLREARQELEAMQQLMKDSSLAVPLDTFLFCTWMEPRWRKIF